MKNKYEVCKDVTMIFLSGKKAGVTLIDTEDLERLLGLNVTWRTSSAGYAVRTKTVGRKKETEFLHRVIMSPDPDLVIDHINGNGLDNRKSNLRVVTQRENCQNKAKVPGRTGIRGVCWDKKAKNWRVQVRIKNELGYREHFQTLEEAKRAAERIRAEYMPYSREAHLKGSKESELA